MYATGQGVTQDFKEAAKWLRLSSEQGIADAQYMLALMYVEGRGVTQDYKEAVKWFRLGAEQGDAKAQFSLAFMYEEGKVSLKISKRRSSGIDWVRNKGMRRRNLI